MKLVGISPIKEQLDAAAFLLSRDRAILTAATGTGKTIVAILSAFMLIQKGLVDRVLFVCTKSSVVSHKDEFAERTDVTPRIIESVSDLLADDPNPFLIIRYELLTDPTEDLSHYLDFLYGHRVAIFYDEFHKVKNPKAQISRIHGVMNPLVDRMYGLSATIYKKNVFDVFHLINFISPNFWTYSHFKDSYTIHDALEVRQKGSGALRSVDVLAGYKNFDGLRDELSKIVYAYFPKLDVRYVEKAFTISEPAVVSEYERAARGVVRDSERVKNMPASRLFDLQSVVDRSDSKKQAFRQQLVELQKSGVVVYCAFYDTIDEIRPIVLDVFGDGNVDFLTAAASTKKRGAIKSRFRESPEGRCVVLTDAGAESLTLSSTNHIVLYNIPFSAGGFIQTIGRIVRPFSEFSEYYIHVPIAEDTIDRYKMDFISSHAELLSSVFNADLLPDKVGVSFQSECLRRLRSAFLWKNE